MKTLAFAEDRRGTRRRGGQLRQQAEVLGSLAGGRAGGARRATSVGPAKSLEIRGAAGVWRETRKSNAMQRGVGSWLDDG